MSANNQQKKRRWGLILLAAIIVLLAAALLVRTLGPNQTPNQPTRPAHSDAPTAPVESEPVQTIPAQIKPVEDFRMDLGHGLAIIDAGSYTGVYMEDGTDELVSDVLMILVRNEGAADYQLADIELSWNGETHNFRLTNLPAGEKVVLLEQERKPCPNGAPDGAVVKNAVIFPEPMEAESADVEITGLDGMLNVRNISGAEITGDIVIYYKYASDDLFYGGITFRVRLEGGLEADEIRQVPAGHYAPGRCAIVQVTVG